MRRSLFVLALCAVFPAASLAVGPAQQAPDSSSNPSSSSDSSSSSGSSPSPSSQPNPGARPRSPKSKTSKKQPAVPQSTVVDTDTPLPPDSAEKDTDVAEYYIHKGDPDAAIPRLEEAIQEKPQLAKPRLILAEIYEKRGDRADAVKCYQAYLEAFPTAPDAKKIEKKIEKLNGE
jgi:tetratricopeptide (TPR) repeat protein